MQKGIADGATNVEGGFCQQWLVARLVEDM
jgi:hypothetical protein